MGRPSILLITSDQQRWDTLGAQNPAIETPALDRLAADGILFDRGYTVNPVCTPSRCSILTGEYPARHGCFHVGTNLPLDYGPTVPDLLASSGYATALLGKAHFQACLDPSSFESLPAIDNLDFYRSWTGPYFGFEHAELVIGHTSENHGCRMHYGAWLVEQGVDRGEYFGIYPYTHHGAWTLPQEYHGSRWVADRTIARLEELAQRDSPFFVWASFQDPHNPYVVPHPWADKYDGSQLPLPELSESGVESKPPFYESLQRGEYYGQLDGFAGRENGDTRVRPEVDRTALGEIHASYYGMVSLMDHHIGRVLDALSTLGLDGDTIVIFSSDHGDYLGHHNLWGKGLPAYEDIQRVPFIVRHPECSAPGSRSDSLQSLVDIGTTALAAAGIDLAPGMQGVDQTPAWTDPEASVRDHAFLEFQPTDGPFTQWTTVFPRHKLVQYSHGGFGELYDLDEDPDQRANLYDDPHHADLRCELSIQACRAAMSRGGTMRERMAPA